MCNPPIGVRPDSNPGAYLITPDALDCGDGPWPACGLINLDDTPLEAMFQTLPPVPLLGFGNPTHPLCARLDARVEPPVSVAQVLRQVARAPLAAAAAMTLLRGTDGADLTAALGLESLCYGMLQGSAEHVAWRAARPVCPQLAGAVIVERAENTLLVTLDRPWAHNAIDRTMRDQLSEAFMLAVFDRDISVIRLRATGAAFSVGADLDEFGTTTDPATAHALRARSLPALALARWPGLLQAHIHGACIGAALELVAFAGRLTASPKAWFQLPELAMGIIPGAGGCVSLPRRIGRQRTALMLLSGCRINAATALSWGLIDAIMDEAPVDERGAHHVG